jgi:cyclase
VEEHGAGEILIQSIDNDGRMSGYDLDLVAAVADAVEVPVVALGGAGTLGHMSRAISEGRASAAAAGSMFVYLGPLKGVLINYPTNVGQGVLC